MNSNNIIGSDDSLTCADVQRTDQTIDVYEELRRMGFYLRDGEWFTSRESRHTCHFCRRIITNPVAGTGEVSRLELYQNRNEPGRGLAIAYQSLEDLHAGLQVHNRFFSNDPGYHQRHSSRITERLRSVTHEEIQGILAANLYIGLL